MTVHDFLEEIKSDPGFMANVECIRTLPANEARYADFPPELDSRIADVLRARGISRLYSHQRQALDMAFRGRDFVVVMPCPRRGPVLPLSRPSPAPGQSCGRWLCHRQHCQRDSSSFTLFSGNLIFF